MIYTDLNMLVQIFFTGIICGLVLAHLAVTFARKKNELKKN